MTYLEALTEAASNIQLVRCYDRLFNAHFEIAVLKPKSPIERMVDESTGFSKDETRKFDQFFYEYIWSRLPEEAFAT